MRIEAEIKLCNKKVDRVIFNLTYAQIEACVRDSSTACLKDDIAVKGWALQGSKRKALQHQSSNNQEARFGNQQGNVQVFVFDVCKDPNYFGHQIQVRDGLSGQWLLEIRQNSTGQVIYVTKPKIGGTVNFLPSGLACGPF